jgi:hypothetical protein
MNINRMGLCKANHLDIDLETEVIRCKDYLYADAAHLYLWRHINVFLFKHKCHMYEQLYTYTNCVISFIISSVWNNICLSPPEQLQ